MHRILGFLTLLSLACLSTGCAAPDGVRYVYQDGDFGVVGIPENSDAWPTHYRQRAEKLMDAHFPEGHEIVRAEEVVEGERILKRQGSNTAEVAPQIPAALINVAKIGHSETITQADTLKIKECRIVYRRVGIPDKAGRYAPIAALNPTLYIDPNEVERHSSASKPGPGATRDGNL